MGGKGVNIALSLDTARRCRATMAWKRGLGGREASVEIAALILEPVTSPRSRNRLSAVFR